MAKTVDEYITTLQEPGREWVSGFVECMRGEYPEISEGIAYQIPTYKFGNTYVAFSATQGHFTFHTQDFVCLEMLKIMLPGVRFGKGSAKVDYTDKEARQVLKASIRLIVHRALEGAEKPEEEWAGVL